MKWVLIMLPLLLMAWTIFDFNKHFKLAGITADERYIYVWVTLREQETNSAH